MITGVGAHGPLPRWRVPDAAGERHLFVGDTLFASRSAGLIRPAATTNADESIANLFLRRRGARALGPRSRDHHRRADQQSVRAGILRGEDKIGVSLKHSRQTGVYNGDLVAVFSPCRSLFPPFTNVLFSRPGPRPGSLVPPSVNGSGRAKRAASTMNTGRLAHCLEVPGNMRNVRSES